MISRTQPDSGAVILHVIMYQCSGIEYSRHAVDCNDFRRNSLAQHKNNRL